MIRFYKREEMLIASAGPAEVGLSLSPHDWFPRRPHRWAFRFYRGFWLGGLRFSW